MKYVLFLACSIAYSQQIYDLLLKDGRVIDPANHRDARLDVAVIGNRIVKVASGLPEAHARLVVNVSGYMVTPGLIDINTHLKRDYLTLPYGVTTAVSGSDAGLQFGVAQKNFPDTISSGMDSKNVLIPRANLSTAMSIYLNLGMTAEQVIERVTSNAARAIKRADVGALNEGSVADIVVLEIQEGKFGFLDSALTRLDANRRFRCLLTMRNGVIVWDSEGLSLRDTSKAGPYTNFK
jgi:predicted amidohydrolase